MRRLQVIAVGFFFFLVIDSLRAIDYRQSRVRREDDGGFWWEKPAADGKTETTTNKTDDLAGRNIDSAVVAQILANGPPDAGKTSPHPGECVCVPYYLCDGDNIITDGAGIIDIRQKETGPAQLVGGNCPGTTEVCCKAPKPEPVPDIAPPREAFVSQCGVRNAEGLVARITNFKNNEAQYGEFPWMVAVLREQVSASTGKTVDSYQCGGSLIHPSVVLTVAHCVVGKDPKSLKIRVGEWDTQSAYEFFPHQDRAVVDAIIHEQYYAPALFNDVALLFLDKPVDLGPEADVICLPRPQDVFNGATCYATGWGKDQFGQAGKYQHILKKIDLPVVPRDRCQASLRTTRLGNSFRLHESFICAGGEKGKDTCKGDGGSPLVCPIPGTSNPKRFVQVGMVAWGIGCGENAVPGVYVNMPGAVSWIEQKLASALKLPEDFIRKQHPKP